MVTTSGGSAGISSMSREYFRSKSFIHASSPQAGPLLSIFLVLIHNCLINYLDFYSAKL